VERRSKLTTASEAAALVGDGATVAVGGMHSHAGPMPIVRELIRQGTKDLTLVPNVSAGLPADLLIAGGGVRRVYACYIGLEQHGLAPAFRRAAERGRIEIRDVDEPFLVYALKAGSANLPFMPLPHGHRATQTMELNPESYRLVQDPFSGYEYVAIPALQPDVGIIHAQAADPHGNVFIDGPLYQDDLIAKASQTVIVTTDELVHPRLDLDGRAVSIPGFLVDAVVPLPFAAHPTSSHRRYLADHDQLAAYANNGPAPYVRRFVLDVDDHQAYLEAIGAPRLADLVTPTEAGTERRTQEILR
jgi:glutaconate CoA-transferase, subunit A